MKSPAPACQKCREAMRLEAGGALPPEQRAAAEQHLAACADCRGYECALRTATNGLRHLATPRIEPSPGFRARWTSAVKQADQTSPLAETVAALVAWSRQWVWHNRRVLAALAPVWMLILVFRFTAPDVGKPAETTVARSPVEVMLAIGVKQNTQIAFDRSPPQPPQPNPPAAAPRSDRAPARRTSSREEPQPPAEALASISISNLKFQISNPRPGGPGGAAGLPETAFLS